MSKTHPKVLVIGLDCGTFRFIRPFVAEGRLPNLKRVMTEGVVRTLKSTIPPVSPPAWTTFLTGKNPGRHGIFQFVNMDIKDYAFTSNRLINSSFFSGTTFIDLISNSGMKVGVIKIPFTYPPWKVNGFMIAGEPSPDWKKAHTYPPSLAEMIGRVNLGSSTDFMLYGTKKLFEHLRYDCEVRTKITCEMLETENSDFFMVVHNVTDAAAHRFWKFTDPECPNYKKKFKGYENIIRDVYEMVDTSIGQILEKIGSETTVFLMSDHGAERNPRYIFHLNNWLKEEGYLRNDQKKNKKNYLYNAIVAIKHQLPPKMRNLLFSAIKQRFLKNVSNFQTAMSNFDWSDTLAYAVNVYKTYDGIVLNLKGRQSYGIVSPGSHANQLLDEIEYKLKKVKDPKTGRNVIQSVHRREDLYKGDHSNKMPDLIVKYHPDYRGGKDSMPPTISAVPATDFEFQSGDHDENGIFIAWGPKIKRGSELPPVGIEDLAPTILYTMGLGVPPSMDGRVMQDIYHPDFIQERPITITAEDGASVNPYDLSEKEQDEMNRQLKGLGYM